jgi:hypothetical protein
MVDYEIRLGRADGRLSCLFIVAQWSDSAAIALGRAVKRNADSCLEIWRGDVKIHCEMRPKHMTDHPRPVRSFRHQPAERHAGERHANVLAHPALVHSR